MESDTTLGKEALFFLQVSSRSIRRTNVSGVGKNVGALRLSGSSRAIGRVRRSFLCWFAPRVAIGGVESRGKVLEDRFKERRVRIGWVHGKQQLSRRVLGDRVAVKANRIDNRR